MSFTIPIKHLDIRVYGKPGTRGRLGPPALGTLLKGHTNDTAIVAGITGVKKYIYVGTASSSMGSNHSLFSVVINMYL